jgi:hypothetical protein
LIYKLNNFSSNVKAGISQGGKKSTGGRDKASAGSVMILPPDRSLRVTGQDMIIS